MTLRDSIRLLLCFACLPTVGSSFAQPETTATAAPGGKQLTIYNQLFAVVKERRKVDLRAGTNEVRVTDVTAHVEPDSVIVRSVSDQDGLRVIEQNYESDPLSQGLLLMKNEGRTIKVEIPNHKTGEREIRKARIVRSGYVPHKSQFGQFDSQYSMAQSARGSYSGGGETILEMDGKIRFGIPGTPIFDSVESQFLKPTLLWLLNSERSGQQEIEFSYISRGWKWEATYNVVAPETGDVFSLVGWVTMSNQSGLDFDNASVKLMAGDVARAPEQGRREHFYAGAALADSSQAPNVTQRSFDEYHLYDLKTTTTLRDREIKQVEFARADKMRGKRVYVYDGFVRPASQNNVEYIRQDRSYGTISNPKVNVGLEFKNSVENGMGIPLPRGTVKLYRQDIDQRNEFIGEDRIDHTPKDEMVRVQIGNAFDLQGERRQMSYNIDTGRQEVTERFEIKLRNHKKEPVEIRVVEHLYRWLTWEITEKSDEFTKKDSQTIEFVVTVPPDQEKVITYTAFYRW